MASSRDGIRDLHVAQRSWYYSAGERGQRPIPCEQLPNALNTSIALVGLPGSGKSTVGRHLARQLGLRFVDSDAEIERRIGMPIKDYFAAR